MALVFLITHTIYGSRKINDTITLNLLPVFVMLKLNYRDMDGEVSESCNNPTENNVQAKKLNFSDPVI